MCNKVECKWNSNGCQCNNKYIMQLIKGKDMSYNLGIVIREDKIVHNAKII